MIKIVYSIIGVLILGVLIFIFFPNKLPLEEKGKFKADSKSALADLSFEQVKTISHLESIEDHYNIQIGTIDFEKRYLVVSNAPIEKIVYNRYYHYRLGNQSYYGDVYYTGSTCDTLYVYETPKILFSTEKWSSLN